MPLTVGLVTPSTPAISRRGTRICTRDLVAGGLGGLGRGTEEETDQGKGDGRTGARGPSALPLEPSMLRQGRCSIEVAELA